MQYDTVLLFALWQIQHDPAKLYVCVCVYSQEDACSHKQEKGVFH